MLVQDRYWKLLLFFYEGMGQKSPVFTINMNSEIAEDWALESGNQASLITKARLRTLEILNTESIVQFKIEIKPTWIVKSKLLVSSMSDGEVHQRWASPFSLIERLWVAAVWEHAIYFVIHLTLKVTFPKSHSKLMGRPSRGQWSSCLVMMPCS